MVKNKIKKIINREAILYILFGIMATSLNIFLFYLFVAKMRMLTLFGNILGTIICILFQYFTNRIWVFKSINNGKDVIKEFWKFLLARSITVIIDEIFVVVGVDFFVVRFIELSKQSMYGVGIKILSNIVIIILNYILSKYYVFYKAK